MHIDTTEEQGVTIEEHLLWELLWDTVVKANKCSLAVLEF